MNHENIEHRILNFQLKARVDEIPVERRQALLDSLELPTVNNIDTDTALLMIYLRQSINNKLNNNE